MTPDEWLARALATVEQLALAFAGEDDEAVERKLTEFGQGVRAGWRDALRGLVSEADIDSMIIDLLARVRARRRELEAAGAGTA